MGEPLTTPVHALVVEDHEETRSSLTASLQKAGFRVTAVGGKSGLHLIEQNGTYDLLVCNLHYNDVDARLLLGLAEERRVPTLAVAPAYAEFEAREACLLGADSVWALPVDTERFLARAAQLAPYASSSSGDRQTVLIVDDNDATRGAMRATLEEAGCNVLEAPDGMLGIRMASRHTVHLIVLDINMPGLNGLGVCEVLKTQRSTRHIPVLICTVRSEDEDKLAAVAAAADDYLTKPFRPDAFIRRVGSLITLPAHQPI